jgi:hypothetical protein
VFLASGCVFIASEEMHGCTQNPNESFNSCIWERLPTNTFVRLTAMKIGVMDAVIHFNEVANSRVKVLQSMGIVPGQKMRTSL